MLTLKQAFSTAAALQNAKTQVKLCEACPMHALHKLCERIEGSQVLVWKRHTGQKALLGLSSTLFSQAFLSTEDFHGPGPQSKHVRTGKGEQIFGDLLVRKKKPNSPVLSPTR